MKRSTKFKHLLEIVIAAVLIILFNYIASFKFTRIDLTEDKLHTLSPRTEEFLTTEIDHVINIDVYLDGELPAYIQKLKNAIQEKIEEFKAYGGSNIKYRFINPNEDEVLAEEYKKELADLGLYPTYIVDKGAGSEEFMEIWPGAKVMYGDQQKAIQFLPGGNFLASPYHVSTAINQLEYNFIKVFWQLTKNERKTISFLRGHGELNNAEAWAIQYELKQFYEVDTVRIIDSTGNENLRALDKSDGLIIAQPKSQFTEKEKYVIDQYIMNGGKVFWAIDLVDVNEDSLSIEPMIYSELLDVNLDNMLFKYGARINKNLVTDASCAPTTRRDNYKVLNNWFFYPLVTKNDSKYTNNVAPVRLKYASSLDPVGDENVKKTVLLETSNQYKIMPAKTRISYLFLDGYNPTKSDELPENPTQPLALLLDGTFTSHFKGRINNEFANNKDSKFKESSVPNKMVVISDGDIIKNEFGISEQGRMLPYGLQFDPNVRDQNNQVVPVYGNGVFFTNIVDELMGNEYLIPLRSRMKVQRLLNMQEVSANKRYWQQLNIVIPIILVLVFGLLQWFIRKRRYIS